MEAEDFVHLSDGSQYRIPQVLTIAGPAGSLDAIKQFCITACGELWGLNEWGEGDCLPVSEQTEERNVHVSYGESRYGDWLAHPMTSEMIVAAIKHGWSIVFSGSALDDLLLG